MMEAEINILKQIFEKDKQTRFSLWEEEGQIKALTMETRRKWTVFDKEKDALWPLLVAARKYTFSASEDWLQIYLEFE